MVVSGLGAVVHLAVPPTLGMGRQVELGNVVGFGWHQNPSFNWQVIVRLIVAQTSCLVPFHIVIKIVKHFLNYRESLGEHPLDRYNGFNNCK